MYANSKITRKLLTDLRKFDFLIKEYISFNVRCIKPTRIKSQQLKDFERSSKAPITTWLNVKFLSAFIEIICIFK